MNISKVLHNVAENDIKCLYCEHKYFHTAHFTMFSQAIGNSTTYWLLGREDAPLPKSVDGVGGCGFLPDLDAPVEVAPFGQTPVAAMIGMLDDPNVLLKPVSSSVGLSAGTVSPAVAVLDKAGGIPVPLDEELESINYPDNKSKANVPK